MTKHLNDYASNLRQFFDDVDELDSRKREVGERLLDDFDLANIVDARPW